MENERNPANVGCNDGLGAGAEARCGCRACLRERKEGITNYYKGQPYFLPAEMMQMVVCAKCGNKRCPHATDHRHDCTNSNEAGQPGSYYGGMPEDA